MGWQDDEWEQFVDDDDEWGQLTGDEDGDDDNAVSLLCGKCNTPTLGESYVCDRCEAVICKSCAIPAVDDLGDVVAICRECAGDSHYGEDD